jgi:hypothetical protein
MSYQCPRCHWVYEVGPADHRLPPWCPKCGADLKPDEWRRVNLPATLAEAHTPPSFFAEPGEVTSVTSTGPKPWLNPRPAPPGPAPEAAPPAAAPEPAVMPGVAIATPPAELDWRPILTLATLIGFVLLGVAAALAWEVRAFADAGQTTTGEVVRTRKVNRQAFGLVRSNLAIGYQVNGTRYELPAGTRDRGEKVPIVYAPADPQDARVDTPGSLYRWPLLLGSVGLVLLVTGGLGVMILPDRKDPEAAPAEAEGTTA